MGLLKNALVSALFAEGALFLSSLAYRNTDAVQPKVYIAASSIDLNYAPPTRIKVLPGHGPYNRTLNFGTHAEDADEFQFTLLAAKALVAASGKFSGFNVENLKTFTQYTDNLRSYMTGAHASMKPPGALLRFDEIPNDTASYVRHMRHMRDHGEKISGNSQDIAWRREREYCDALGDLELILHLDLIESSVKKRSYADSGFSISVSPYNERFNETIAIAESISTHLAEVINISTAEYFATLPVLHRHEPQLVELGKYGIRLREDLPQLGKKYYAAKKPTLLIELEHFPKRHRLANNSEHISDAIMRGIVAYYDRP